MSHSLVAVRHRARRARITRDHRIKSPLGMHSDSAFRHKPSPILARLARSNRGRRAGSNQHLRRQTRPPCPVLPQCNNAERGTHDAIDGALWWVGGGKNLC